VQAAPAPETQSVGSASARQRRHQCQHHQQDAWAAPDQSQQQKGTSGIQSLDVSAAWERVAQLVSTQGICCNYIRTGRPQRKEDGT
jgi:hypothetical protein